jgi:hypothetical protein
MAFVVARPNGRFEIRESVSTGRGPRARTLAGFRVLTPHILDHAAERARGGFDAAKIRRRAAALGARQQLDGAGATARRLIGQLRNGERLPAALTKALRSSLPRGDGTISDALTGALDWIGVGDVSRGHALYELLDLASYLPAPPREPKLEFPRITTSTERS